MANDFTSNPITIDSTFTTAAHPFKSRMFIKTIVWTKMAAGDRLILTDRNAKTVVDIIAPLNNDNPIHQDICTWVNGLACTQIDAGLVQIFV
jgi:hypothetical protein